MWPTFQHFVRFLLATNRRKISSRPRVVTFRPHLEALEDRRLMSAGALDPTFGNGAGYITTSFSTKADQADSVLIQPDGKILATGGVVRPHPQRGVGPLQRGRKPGYFVRDRWQGA
jgi:hypothetical protein